MQGPLGVYIHFPWCRKLCPYCDFAVAVVGRDGIPHEAYLEAVLGELAERAAEVAGRRLVSIYFGGGTPSLWAPACLARMVDAVTSAFGAADRDALEITLEANPGDCVPERLAAWQQAGIGRLSIGVQSLVPRALAVLGRDHRQGDGAAALTAAREAGFARVSADIIFGVPGDDGARGEVDPSIAAVADTGVGHLSIYELTIEERTAFGRAARQGSLVPLADDALADMYVAVHERLTGRGYEHYEVSSYARPGHGAVHNALYWSGGEYLGLGSGAASFVRRADGSAVRCTNDRSAKRYLRARGDARVAQREVLTPAEVACDLAWLGMRTSAGVAAGVLDARVRAWLLAEGLAEAHGDRICPTLRGFLYSDHIAARLVSYM